MRALAFILALLSGAVWAIEPPPCNATVDHLKLQATRTQTAPVLVWNMAGVGAVWACKVSGAWQPFHIYATWPWMLGRPADEASRALRRFVARPDDFWASVQGRSCDWHVKQTSFSAESAICREVIAERDKLMAGLK